MKKTRELLTKMPLLSGIVVSLVFYGLYIGLGALMSFIPDGVAVGFLEETVFIAFPIVLLFVCGYQKVLTVKGFLKGIVCGLAWIIPQSILLLTQVITGILKTDAVLNSLPTILLGVFMMISIGVREEIVYRGIIQNVFMEKYSKTNKGIWLSILLSSLLFGLTHAFNLFHGVEPLGVLVQVITTTGIGTLFGAVYARSGSIYALIFIHAFTDFAGLYESVFFKTTHVEIMSKLNPLSMITALVLMLIAFFIVRPSKCDDIRERFQRNFL